MKKIFILTIIFLLFISQVTYANDPWDGIWGLWKYEEWNGEGQDQPIYYTFYDSSADPQYQECGAHGFKSYLNLYRTNIYCLYNKCLIGSGNISYNFCNSSLDDKENFTIMAWLSLDANFLYSNGYVTILSNINDNYKGFDFSISVFDQNHFYIACKYGNGQSYYLISSILSGSIEGTLTCIKKGRELTIYLNNQSLNSIQGGGYAHETSNKLYTNLKYVSRFDELAVWDRALSEEELNYILSNRYEFARYKYEPMMSFQKKNITAYLNVYKHPGEDIKDVNAILVFNNSTYFTPIKISEPIFTENSSLPNGTVFRFVTNVTLPSINNYSENVSIYWQYNITKNNGAIITRNSKIENITIFKYSLYECNGNTNDTVGLRFTAIDEDTNIEKNFTAKMHFISDKYGEFTFSFNNENESSRSICFSPSWAETKVNATIEYGATGYQKRWYWLTLTEISNVTKNITLYLLNSSVSKMLTTYVKDEYNNGVVGAILRFLRYYPEKGQYIEVTQTKTDYQGQNYVWLKNNTWYKTILEKDGRVIKSYEPFMFLTQDSLTFSSSTINIGEFWDYYNKISWSCSFNNVSAILTCSVVDTSGHMTRANLTVYEITPMVRTVACHKSTTSSSATLICSLTPNKTYEYNLIAELASEPTSWLLKSDSISWGRVAIFGISGLFIAILIVLLFSLLGSWNPAVTIISSLIGVSLSFILGLITIGETTFMAVFGLIITGAIIAWKTGT